MNMSANFTKVSASLLKVQKAMGSATKGSSNSYFKNRYADLNSVLEACKDVLNENGLVVLQPHVTTATGEYVETLLLHESGEWISSMTKIEVAKQHDPQALGSAITYARRYGLQSLLSIPAEDDDGEGAMSRNKAAPAATTVKATPTVKASTSVTVSNVTPISGTGTNGKSNSDAGSLPKVKTPDVVLPASKPAVAKTSFRKSAPVVAAATNVSEDII